MKHVFFFISASLLLSSCQVVEQVSGKLRTLVGRPATPVESAPDFVPPPSPEPERDRVLQVSPREKVLSLFEQFVRTPDTFTSDLLIELLEKNKSLFGASRDEALRNNLNRLIPHVQNGDQVTILLLAKLHPRFLGENKDQLRSVLARAFDFHPRVLADTLMRLNEDKLCYLAQVVPAEIEESSKRTFLEVRRQGIEEVKRATGVTAGLLAYLEVCAKTIDLQLGTLPSPPAIDGEALESEDAAATEDSAPQP